MGSPQYDERETAAKSLTKLASRDAEVRAVLKKTAAEHPDIEVRVRARMVLEETEMPFAGHVLGVPDLADRLADPDPKARESLVPLLEGKAEAAPVLLRMLERLEEPYPLRRLAMGALSRLRTPAAAAGLAGLARNVSDPLRGLAVDLMGTFPSEEGTACLMELASGGPQEPERYAALGALARLRAGEALPLFLRLVRDRREPLEIRGVSAIGCERSDAGPSAAAALLEVARRDDEPLDLRLVCVDNLGRLGAGAMTGSATLGEGLMKLVSGSPLDPDLEREAILGLGKAGEARALALLAGKLADPAQSIKVRKACVAALRTLTGRRVGGPLDAQAEFYSALTWGKR